MKPKLQSIIACIIMLVISISGVYGQANLTFSGGNGTPLVTTLNQSISYTITSNCSSAPVFVFQGTGNVLEETGIETVNGNISLSINGGNPILINRENSGLSFSSLAPNDLYVFASNGITTLSPDNTIVLNAGTITTTNSPAAAPPANGIHYLHCKWFHINPRRTL